MVSKRCSIHPLRLKEELKRVVKKLLLLKFIVKTNKWCVSPIIVAIEGLKPREAFEKNTWVENTKT